MKIEFLLYYSDNRLEKRYLKSYKPTQGKNIFKSEFCIIYVMVFVSGIFVCFLCAINSTYFLINLTSDE